MKMTNDASDISQRSSRLLRIIPSLILLLCTFVCSLSIAQYVYVSEFGTAGSEPGQFDGPVQVAIDSNGDILVAEINNSRVQICDFSGNCTVLGGANPPDIFGATGVAEDDQGRIVISDFFNDRIHVCERNVMGNCAIMFGERGSALGQFIQPRNLAIDDQGRIVVADRVNSRIQFCDDTGSCASIGSAGSAVGEFNGPDGVAVDKEGRIIVTDTLNHRIQICATNGSCTAFGSTGPNPGEFWVPTGSCVDHAGRIAVADFQNDRMQICDYQGVCTVLGSQGSGPGEFMRPAGCVADGKGNLIVADYVNQRIQIFNDPNYVPFVINTGLNDAWFNQETAGQGLLLSVFPTLGKMFIAIFTFDTERPGQQATAILGEAGHRWTTGIGDFAGNEAVIEMELSEGGVFFAPIPQVVQTQGYGTVTLTFTDCKTLVLTYDFPGLGLMGTLNLGRFEDPVNIALCESLGGG
ncbi:MAG: hypothetical protein WBM36_01655 [Lysobacterales bacterium]